MNEECPSEILIIHVLSSIIVLGLIIIVIVIIICCYRQRKKNVAEIERMQADNNTRLQESETNKTIQRLSDVINFLNAMSNTTVGEVGIRTIIKEQYKLVYEITGGIKPDSEGKLEIDFTLRVYL